MEQGKYSIRGLTWHEVQEILAVLDPDNRISFMNKDERVALARKISSFK